MAGAQAAMMLSAGGRPPPAAITYNGTAATQGGSSNVQSANVALGAADPDRLLVFVVVSASIYSSPSKAITSASLGGTPLTILNTVTTDVAGAGQFFVRVTVLTARIPIGTSGTVTLTFESGASAIGADISTYSAIGLQSDTPFHTASNFVSAQTIGLSLNVRQDGICVAGVGRSASSYTAWTMTGITENSDAGFTTYAHGSGMLNNGANETGRSIGFQLTGGSGTARQCALAVSWR